MRIDQKKLWGIWETARHNRRFRRDENGSLYSVYLAPTGEQIFCDIPPNAGTPVVTLTLVSAEGAFTAVLGVGNQWEKAR